MVRDTLPFGADDDIMLGRSNASGLGYGEMHVRRSGSMQLSGNSAYFNVGVANGAFSGPDPGIGRLNVTQAGSVRIDGTTSQGGLLIGRGDLSDGEVTVAGVGSRIDITGRSGLLAVANAYSATSFNSTGSGRMIISDGGVVSVRGTQAGTSFAVVGLGLGSGHVIVERGGNLDVDGTLLVSSRYSLAASTQYGRLTIGDQGLVSAVRTQVGDNTARDVHGVLDGTGTLRGSLMVLRGGMVSPGFSPGTLTIDGNARFAGGVLKVEIGGLGAGQFDLLNVLGELSFADALIELDFIDGFVPHAGDSLDFARAVSITGLNLARFSTSGLAPGFEFDISVDGGGLHFRALNDAAAVPAPATLALAMLSLLLLGRTQRFNRPRPTPPSPPAW